MFNQFYKVPYNKVEAVEWEEDPLDYDYQLFQLGQTHKTFLVLNPKLENENLIHYIKEIPKTEKCVVWHHNNQWVAKLFTDKWTPHWNSYLEIEIVKPKYVWRKNPDLDKLMEFVNNPFQNFEPEPWDSHYEHIWYIDSRVNPLDHDVWAISCRPMGIEIKGTKHMGYLTPDIDIEFNPKLSNIEFDLDQCYPAFYDLDYECAWELDKIHQPVERMWVVKFTPKYRKPKNWKWYGYISPQFFVEYNSNIGELNYELDYVIPYHDFNYEHVWMLDRKHLQHGEDDIWAFKIKPTNNVKGSKIIDYISPSFQIEYNDVLPKLNYNLNYIVPWYDLNYKHVWMLDRKHLQNGEDDIWVVDIKFGNNVKGSKIIDYVSPIFSVKHNKDIPNLIYNIEYIIPWYDLEYEHIWMLDKKFANDETNIWAVKVTAKDTKKIKNIGIVVPLVRECLDVIFISYNESNAEKNWQRVLEKAPWAKRVHGVEGIFEAHKQAATLSETDMFYVVDGDAFLVDDWDFNFQPSIFDRDCAYVWCSKNPINDLIYQNGGVKLFSKNVIANIDKWKTLDMFTGIMPKIKIENQVSCITQFNVDEFSTWKSAFREAVKLYKDNQITKLNIWLTKGKDRPFGKYAINGAKAGEIFAKKNLTNPIELSKINNFTWLKLQFQKKYSKNTTT